MPKTLKKYGVPNAENPEWTAADWLKAKKAADIPALRGVLKRTRGQQKAATKDKISIRLSRDVVAALRADGKGWQSRADDILREHVLKNAHR